MRPPPPAIIAIDKRRGGTNQANFEDTFPLPASLMCRSHLKNEFSPNFKAHMVQDCLLFKDGSYFHLMLFGLNFDTSNDAQLGQVSKRALFLRVRA